MTKKARRLGPRNVKKSQPCIVADKCQSQRVLVSLDLVRARGFDDEESLKWLWVTFRMASWTRTNP